MLQSYDKKEYILEEVKPFPQEYVTFGDDKKGRIKGVGKMVRPGIHYLSDVILIEGLTTNLVSTNQLSD